MCPGLGVADRDLAPIREARLHARGALAIDDADVMACFAQIPGRGNADYTCTEDDDVHRSTGLI